MKAPEQVAALDKVKSPEFETVTGPAPVVVTEPLKVKLLPMSDRPPRAFVLVVPANVVVPVPPDCTIAAAFTAGKLTFAAWVIVKVPSRAIDPIAEETVMFPRPLFKVRLWAPFIAPLIVILPEPEPLLKLEAAAKVMGPVKPMAEFEVSTLPPRSTGPDPV